MKGQDRRGRRVSCEWVSQHLDAYLDGELNQARADKVRAHLDVCPACAAQAEEGREIRALIAACDDVAPDAALHDSIMRSVREQPRDERTKRARPSSVRARRIGGALIGVCLVVALMLLPGPLFQANAPQEPSYDAPSANAPDFKEPDSMKPDYDGSYGGNGSYDDESPDVAPSPPADDAPSAEEPEDPVEGGIGSILGDEIQLWREDFTTSEGGGLWATLEGEWMNDTTYLYIDTHAGEFCLITKGIEYYGDASLHGDRLLLQAENGLRMEFKVRMEGDTLWLTRLS
ncbi:MAG: hypothetical protein E7605_01090 [Ruminococcaceae bacterium]|nr:hypothetical protein [Oscillospiraceae bacterium]